MTLPPPPTPEFQIKNNLVQAWLLLKGSKGPMWVALLAWIFISVAILSIAWLTHLVPYPTSTQTTNPLWGILLSLIIVIITTPLFAGMNMIAIKRARGETIHIKTGFQYFNKWIPVGLAFIIIFVVSAALTTLLNLLIDFVIIPILPEKLVNSIVPTLFLMLLSSLFFTLIYTFFIFTVPLITDRQFTLFKALQQSVSTVKTHWLALFGLMAIFYGLSMVNMLIAQIPYVGLICYIIISIWLIPFIFLNIGLAYHQLVDILFKRKNYAQSFLP